MTFAEQARREGFEQGKTFAEQARREGYKQGLEQAKQQLRVTAKLLLEKGISEKIIAETTGLTPNEIKSLAKEKSLTL